MDKKFITIVGANHYHGTEVVKVGQILKLRKDYDNEHDEEAIEVTMSEHGKIGYVSNCYHTRAKGTNSAGRVYDTFGDTSFCKVRFIIRGVIIAEVINEAEEQD